MSESSAASDPLSQSPNPRPKIAVPAEPSWSAEQMRHLANEHNAMIDEIEALSGRLAALGVDPRDVVQRTV
jgi:hypothetical protein